MGANNANNPFTFDRTDVKTAAGSVASAEVTWGRTINGSLYVHNTSAAIAYVRLSDAASVQAADATDFPIPAGAVRILGGSFNRASVILASGTGNVTLVAGQGGQ